jgi:predicted small metal-binding protein
MKEVLPPQTFKACVTDFILCADIGLDCDCIIYETSENNVVNSTIAHMYEHHAINPEEMTTCMKLKISGNIHKLRTNELYYLSV